MDPTTEKISNKPPADYWRYRTVADLPHYRKIPRAYADRIRWRKHMREECKNGSPGLREAVRRWCKEDILFFCNTFGVVHEPRKPHPMFDQRPPEVKFLPFITYPYQDQTLLEINQTSGYEDLIIEKSREMGATWLCLYGIVHSFLFEVGESFMVVSRNEKLVDEFGDPDSLFWKIDCILKFLPKWLRPKTERKKLSLIYPDSDNSIIGASTTGETSRGGRKTRIFGDEFAFVENSFAMWSAFQHNSRSVLLNSTPNGTSGAYYSLVDKANRLNKIRKIRLHWTLHPNKVKGLHIDEQGRPWSHYRQFEQDRAASDVELAREVEIDYGGSQHRFFEEKVLAKARRHIQPPLRLGTVVYEHDEMTVSRWEDDDNGSWRLWKNPDEHDRMPSFGRYVVGVDVAIAGNLSTGTGQSNSTICVYDAVTSEKVAEYANCMIEAHELGRMAVAACRWFAGDDPEGAFLIWEANGPGVTFTNVVVQSGYRNFHWRRRTKIIDRKRTREPGWWSGSDAKLRLLRDYRQALFEDKILNRSDLALAECEQYIHDMQSNVFHVTARETEDPTEAKDNHGDRVIADALCFMGLTERGVPKSSADRRNGAAVPGTLAYRRRHVAVTRDTVLGERWF